MGYEPDPADLALSSIPGQEMFDPRKRKFSEEELKPQPMIKKARKVFIPDDLKVNWNRSSGFGHTESGRREENERGDPRKITRASEQRTRDFRPFPWWVVLGEVSPLGVSSDMRPQSLSRLPSLWGLY